MKTQQIRASSEEEHELKEDHEDQEEQEQEEQEEQEQAEAEGLRRSQRLRV